MPAFFINSLLNMLTINLIREKKEFIVERLKVKNFEAEEIIERILFLDSSRRELQLKRICFREK